MGQVKSYSVEEVCHAEKCGGFLDFFRLKNFSGLLMNTYVAIFLMMSLGFVFYEA